MSGRDRPSAEYSDLAELYRVPPDRLRPFFRVFNRFMVGAFRLGLGPWLSNPYVGYVMVLTTTGRKTGLPRRTPVNYLPGDGEVYCIVAFGPVSDWYRNVLASPDVRVWVGNREWAGRAELIADPGRWIPLFREIGRSAGFAEWVFTKTPLSALSDETLLRLGGEGLVFRIGLARELPKEEGPGDLAWLWPVLGAAFLLRRVVRRRRRRRDEAR